MKIKIIFFLICAYVLSSTLYAQNNKSYKIIVNNDNSITSINKSELSKIFLKKVSLWEGKDKIQPVDLKSNSKTRQKFSEDVHGKSVDAIKAYWQKQIFSGRGVPPTEKKSNREVLNYVQDNPGAIGYVSRDYSTSGVKEVKVNK